MLLALSSVDKITKPNITNNILDCNLKKLKILEAVLVFQQIQLPLINDDR